MRKAFHSIIYIPLVVVIAQLPKFDLVKNGNEIELNLQKSATVNECLRTCLSDYEKISKCNLNHMFKNYLIELEGLEKDK